jgi:superfamily II DNA or RNA helicase
MSNAQINVGGHMKLRPWQEQALVKAIHWLTEVRTDKHFLINAAPGAGKTVAASIIARALIEQDEVDRVVVIAPRAEVVNQWAASFKQVTGRYMTKVTGADGDISGLDVDICATWAAMQGLADALQHICSHNRTLVICDEHHHAAVSAAWGKNTEGALNEAKFSIILTGTPIRSDGGQSVWLDYDDNGRISHPAGGTYTLSYGDAVELEYCRPATFHRHEGKFSVQIDEGQAVSVSGYNDAKLPPRLKNVEGLQTALDFYRLAKTPLYEEDEKTPLLSGFQGSMVDYASQKLDETRHRLPDAGGLVIAPSIKMAEYIAKLLEMIEGEAPIVVHSKGANADSKIRAYKNTTKRWIVSVAMVSEGVDIPRLRVLLYLPSALTELAFRQAIGRVVRTTGPNDDSSAYVVMPSFETFDCFARSVEKEMGQHKKTVQQAVKTKKCPSCHAECALGDKNCSECGYEFPAPPSKAEKPCHSCGEPNLRNAKVCRHCGEKLTSDFVLSLDQALRDGAIVSGMDISEQDVREGERLAPEFRKEILASGDLKLIQMINRLPDASLARAAKVISQCAGYK